MGESNERMVDGSDANLNFENVYIRKKNPFSVMHVEGFIFNAAQKPIRYENGKA